MTSLNELLQGLSSDERVRGNQFERICRWYLLNDHVYSGQLKRVWLWHEWPGRWGADAGIDLVAEDRQGGLWAIQAKAYDASYYIKKRDLDSFLSESSRADFSYRLLIATTNGLGRTAQRTIDGQEKPVGTRLLSDLQRADLAWPRSPESLFPPRLKPKRPLPHQRRAIRDVRDGFQSASRGQLLMACGSGKTLCALWIAEQLEATRTLVLVPSLSLLAQTLREWNTNSLRAFESLPVCSDETVREEDHFTQSTSELGLPVTTEPKDIAHFLKRRGTRVIFATYQSSPAVASALALGAPGFDLVIADEAHRCAGPTQSNFSLVLSDREIRAKRRLFMTATPRYFTERIRKEAASVDFELASMDDEKTFGAVFHQLSFGEAIRRGLLSDYQVVIVAVDNSAYRDYVDRGLIARLETDGYVSDARTIASQLALANSMRKYGLRRVLSFHGRVKRAQEFSSSFPAVASWLPPRKRLSGGLWTAYVSGHMSSGKRDSLLATFRQLSLGDRGLLSNARCLAEGVDVPSIDGVTFVDPKGSSTDIIQAVGRAIRKAPDKRIGTVVLPVFVENLADPIAELNSSVFRPIWSVLKGLRAHDDLLAEQLDELRRHLGRRGTGKLRLPSKIRIEMPTTLSAAFREAFSVRLVQQTTASWEFWFSLLAEYVRREGTSRVTADYKEDGYALGSWVNSQRSLYRVKELLPERTHRLAQLPEWSWTVFADKWDERFSILQRFAEQHGHATPTETDTQDGYPIGRWVQVQRNTYDSRTRTLRPERIERLQALPGWTWDPNETAWERGFGKLLQYVEREANALVPRFHIEDGFRLGYWVSGQRVAQKRARLSPERAARLETLPGWTWHRIDEAWERMYGLLQQFVRREGHGLVPGTHRESGAALGNWVATQRATRKKLDSDKVARLEQVSGWSWDPSDSFWERGFSLLVQFVKREGHAKVPSLHVEDAMKLGSWVGQQRVAFRRQLLRKDRLDRLASVPGWHWEVRRERWDEALKRLKVFVAREGHAQVPVSHVEDGFKLGQWVTIQRTAFKLGRLKPDQIHQLERLRRWNWNVLASQRSRR